MHLTGLDLFFWAASFLGHLVLIFVLWKRHRAKLFPFFTALISTNIIRSIVLYLVMHHGTNADYFYTYWSLVALDADCSFVSHTRWLPMFSVPWGFGRGTCARASSGYWVLAWPQPSD